MYWTSRPAIQAHQTCYTTARTTGVRYAFGGHNSTKGGMSHPMPPSHGILAGNTGKFQAAIFKPQSAATTATRSKNIADDSEKASTWDKDEVMSKIKSYGIAGTISYIITELMFWAIAIPAAAYSYHSTTGEWLSWDTDKAQLAGIAAGFVTVVRFAVPLRMGAALAMTPTIGRLIEGGLRNEKQG